MNELLKQNVLQSGVYEFYKEFQHTAFLYDQDKVAKEVFDYYLEQYQALPIEQIQVCKSIYDSSRSRAKRLRHKIETWAKHGYVYFLTFTFKDSILTNTSADTKRQYVRRFLKSQDFVFCANQDFGGKFGREHYHAVICSKEKLPGTLKKSKDGWYLDSPIFHRWNDKIGFVNVQGPILMTDETKKDSLKVSKYVSKCSNHALKETAQRSSLVYSRNKPTWYNIQDSSLGSSDGFIELTEEDLTDLPFFIDENA